MEIKMIKPEDTYELRHTILRPNQSIEDCQYPGDDEKDSFHVGAYMKGKLVSIASFYKETHPNFNEENQFRLRGMATLAEFRGQNAGSALIRFAEKFMKKQSADLWWCNARVSVSAYYKKLSLQEKGGIFTIEPIGPHKLMYKKL
ncbi:GNAT superfamily N-acetyltransferase [Bacillus pakistanensis]|uniref:GNAT superfamily N-acetyltransferase n=1 Tax=Rossellomorea pakistanensis TaxID=992288 RepID=A0ABS2N7T7_9BACI|nr:GNAT family N-acetyltransferase [Bacillus pakistanensis]MBM7583849.1 GNAT superfamily N-acetyltransferase [Bacillus pakistanensis]